MMNNTNKTKTIEGCIFLIGFMACGKTTVGKNLSRKLSIPFIDTDKIIVDREGMPISEIFARYGEPYFRDLETKVIEEFAHNPTAAVCSVGGGLPMREKNRSLMKQAGTVVYLHATTDTLLSRLRGDQTRPLVAGCKNEAELRERIEQLMDKRDAIYHDAADLIIETDNGSVSNVASSIIHHL